MKAIITAITALCVLVGSAAVAEARPAMWLPPGGHMHHQSFHSPGMRGPYHGAPMHGYRGHDWGHHYHHRHHGPYIYGYPYFYDDDEWDYCPPYPYWYLHRHHHLGIHLYVGPNCY